MSTIAIRPHLYGDEHFDREQLDNKLYENSGQKNEIKAQLQALDRRKQDEANRQRRWHDLHAFCDAIKAGLGNLAEDERQRLLRLLLERVTITGKSIRIELAVPLDDPQAVYRLRPMDPPPSPPETQISRLRLIGSQRRLVYQDNVAAFTGGSDLEQRLERGLGPDGYDGLLLNCVNVDRV